MYEIKNNEDVNVSEGRQRQIKGINQKKRGELIGDDLEVIKGINNILVGTLQEVYGMTKDQAEKKVREYKL